jgi:hypothetical protein
MKHKPLIAGILIVLLVGAAAAATVTTVPASGNITSETNEGLAVTFEGVSAYPSDPFVDNETVRAQRGTISSTGQGAVSLPAGILMDGTLTVDLDDATAEVVIDADDKPAVGVQGSIQQVVLNATIDADDDGTDISYTSNGLANISIAGLDAGESYILTDDATGQGLATGTADNTGQVTFVNVQQGDFDATLTNFAIQVFEVSDDPELIDDVTVTFRIFEEDTERVFTRSSSTGVVSVADLPADTAFSVTAQAPGYVSRQTFIESARQQQQVYLLENTTDTQLVRFNLEDRTGNFDRDARIQILRSINASGTPTGQERYQVVAGDIVGSQLEFDTELEREVRYKVRVSNDEGDSRELGSVFVLTDRAIDLVISGIDVGFDVPDDMTTVNASQTVNQNTGAKTVSISLIDPSQSTSNIQITARNARDATEVYDTTTEAGPIGTLQFSTTLTGADAEDEVIFEYSYDREGETVSGTIAAGTERFPITGLEELDPGWAQIFGVGFMIVVAGIFSRANARIGAIVLPGVGLLLYTIGILDGAVTVFSIAVAFALAIAINLISGSGEMLRA